MKNNFDSIDYSKQKELINNGYNEFATQEYKRSSLNTILTKSKISKGFFYHYFENKDDFYNYLVERSIHLVVNKLNQENILDEQDYIQRLQSQAILKLELADEFPNLFLFLAKYYKTMSHEDYMKLLNEMTSNFGQRFLYENIDFSLFKDDIPKDLAIKVIGRYNHQILFEIDQMDKKLTFNEIIQYYKTQFEDIKKILYKKEK